MNNRNLFIKTLLPHAALSTTVIFWGLSFASTKVILNSGLPPLTLAFIRFMLASVLLFPALKLLKSETKISKSNLIPLMLSGFLGVTVYFFFENKGIRLTTASNAALIIAAIPVFTILAEYILYRQSVKLYKIFGVLISIAGVYLLIGNPGGDNNGTQKFVGNLLMLGACLSWVAYIQFSKKLNKSFSGLSLTTFQSFFGTIFLFPLAIIEHRSWIMVGWDVGLNIFYLGIFCSATCYFLYLYALARLDSLVVSSYINIIPVVGALGGVVLLGEKLTSVQIIGGTIVILGVIIVNLRLRNRTDINTPRAF